jgi:single-stranded DNA-binding protein
MGRLIQDPVSRSFSGDRCLTKFTVAVEGEFASVLVFSPLAKPRQEWLVKGRSVYVEGKLHTSKWEDENRVLHAKTEIYAESVLLLDKTHPSL